MNRKGGRIAFVHQDASGGTSLVRIARAAKLQAELYASIEAFLAADDRADVECAVLHETQPDDIAFQALRESKGAYGKLLPVILLAGKDDAESRQRARDLGAAGFFREPADGEALLDAIRWLLCDSKTPEDPESKSLNRNHD
ncbi:Response regulator protein TodT [Planctomycetes bacterium CA13]|uniref:Response regulator protein TodT n=1 Tax=Novipirellula herctigrandis TaxID=2527986 RepID=A0A5C5YPJ5_9BACT|nr:Response regulator protein TodT [Planctomycetes bacterium CA13]